MCLCARVRVREHPNAWQHKNLKAKQIVGKFVCNMHVGELGVIDAHQKGAWVLT
jgi:hypothetical protein